MWHFIKRSIFTAIPIPGLRGDRGTVEYSPFFLPLFLQLETIIRLRTVVLFHLLRKHRYLHATRAEISPFYFFLLILCCQSNKKFTFGALSIHFESFVCRFETIFRRSIPQLFYVPEIFQEKSGNRRIVSSLSLSPFSIRFARVAKRKKEKLKWIASRRDGGMREHL